MRMEEEPVFQKEWTVRGSGRGPTVQCDWKARDTQERREGTGNITGHSTAASLKFQVQKCLLNFSKSRAPS